MGKVLDLSDSLERSVARQVADRITGMDIAPGERAIAINTAVYRVRNGRYARDAVGEAVHYARLREQEHANRWYRLGAGGFEPAQEG